MSLICQKLGLGVAAKERKASQMGPHHDICVTGWSLFWASWVPRSKVTLSYSSRDNLSESIRNNLGRYKGIGGLHREGQSREFVSQQSETIRVVTWQNSSSSNNNNIQILCRSTGDKGKYTQPTTKRRFSQYQFHLQHKKCYQTPRWSLLSMTTTM